jgi:hypothetical protein
MPKGYRLYGKMNRKKMSNIGHANGRLDSTYIVPYDIDMRILQVVNKGQDARLWPDWKKLRWWEEIEANLDRYIIVTTQSVYIYFELLHRQLKRKDIYIIVYDLRPI